ncbi:MAG: sigma-54 dependent transcriptional regulator [bacterium]
MIFISTKIIVLDDDVSFCSVLSVILEKKGCIVKCLNTSERITQHIKEFKPNLILLDVVLPERSGLEVLAEIKLAIPNIPVVMISNREDSKLVVAAMKAGAYDYIPKTLDPEDLWDKIKDTLEIEDIKSTEKDLKTYSPILGNSYAAKNLIKMISKVSQTDAPVFLRGESGTGKSLIAETIHNYSRRKGKPFVTINCPAIPATLLESELFGHEKGSFTGAIRTKEGKFEIAEGGTIFLDEIGDLSIDLQVKILRIIQNKEFERVGGLKTIKTNVRIIAATNGDVETAVKSGRFREDLFYRLNVLPIYIPALRDRKDDIPIFIEHFMGVFSKRENKKFNKLSTEVMDALCNYPWPGNIRELENVLERAVILGKEPELTISDFNFASGSKSAGNYEAVARQTTVSSPSPYSSGNVSLKDIEYRNLLDALQKTSGNMSQTAKLLGISRDTLYRRMKKHGIGLKS